MESDTVERHYSLAVWSACERTVRPPDGLDTLRAMATLVLTVIGDDRNGLVNAVAEVVARHGGNWEQSQMAELAGKFAGIVLVTVADDGVDALVGALEPLQGMLDITAQRGSVPVTVPEAQRFVLDLVGSDRPGIVREITEVLAAHGVNIESLRTEASDAPMSGGRLFEAHAVLEVDASTDLGALRVALERLADELMVDIDLEQRAG
jgi:glycine cleavage system regulatory protein